MEAGSAQPERASGGVPNAFGNALAWRWVKDMPRPLRAGFLKLLYALRAIARPDGRIGGERGPYRITQIAQACGADEKDTRRYLRAAGAAGIVVIEGEQKRGRTTRYAIVVHPDPRWDLAAAVLEESRAPAKSAKKDPPWREQDDDPSSGDRPPNSGEDSSGDGPPNSSEDGSGDRPPNGFGGPTPEGFGGPTPEYSGCAHVSTHEMAGVGDQPQDARAREPLRAVPTDGIRDPLPAVAGVPGQRAMLLSVAGPSPDGEGIEDQDDDGGVPYGRCDGCERPFARPPKNACPNCGLMIERGAVS